MNKKFFQIIPLMLVVFAFAKTEEKPLPTDKNGKTEEKMMYDQGYDIKEDQMMKVYNYPARVDVKGDWDYYMTLSFIYWQPKMYLPYGYGYIGDGEGDDFEESYELKKEKYLVGFDYHPGFKVGFGTNTDMDDWNLFLEYTRLTTIDSSVKTNPASLGEFTILFPDRVYRIPYGNRGEFLPYATDSSYIKGRSKFYINLLDMELGRYYYVGQKLKFAPFVGIRGGWIEQKNTTKIRSWNVLKTEEAYIYYKEKSDTWLLGPRAGLDSNWCLGRNFRMIANVAASLFYQHYKIDVKQDLPVQSNDSVTIDTERLDKEKLKDYLFNPCFEVFLGFGWGQYFANNTWFVDISFGYELQHFLNQYYIGQIKYCDFRDGDNTMSDLTLHGLTCNFRIDF